MDINPFILRMHVLSYNITWKFIISGREREMSVYSYSMNLCGNILLKSVKNAFF